MRRAYELTTVGREARTGRHRASRPAERRPLGCERPDAERTARGSFDRVAEDHAEHDRQRRDAHDSNRSHSRSEPAEAGHERDHHDSEDQRCAGHQQRDHEEPDEDEHVAETQSLVHQYLQDGRIPPRALILHTSSRSG
jgi:hypothetical protein